MRKHQNCYVIFRVSDQKHPDTSSKLIQLSLWHTSQSWTLIPGGPPFTFMTARTLPWRLSIRCLNISGGIAAQSSYRAVARAVSGVGCWGLERSWRSNSSHVFYGIQVRTLGWPVCFWNHIVHKPYPHGPWFRAGSTLMLIQTIVITELVFYCRQYATGQNVLVSFCVYISVQYYKRAKSIPWKRHPHWNATSKFHNWHYTCWQVSFCRHSPHPNPPIRLPHGISWFITPNHTFPVVHCPVVSLLTPL
jgi:hypothetical protein